MISTILQTKTMSISTDTAKEIANAGSGSSAVKNRAGKVYFSVGSEEWLAARLFHPVGAVQKDLFKYLVCHRKEFCGWLRLQHADRLSRQEKLFSGISGFTICVLNPENNTARPGRLISSNPQVSLPPPHAKFKVIGIEVIFRGLQEVLGLTLPTSHISTKETMLLAEQYHPLVTPDKKNSARKFIVARIQGRQISLAKGANMLGVSTRTVSRLRARGESSYSSVADYQVFCELLGRTTKKLIASRYGITERTVWNIQARVLAKLLELLILQS